VFISKQVRYRSVFSYLLRVYINRFVWGGRGDELTELSAVSQEEYSPWRLLVHFLSGTLVFVVVALFAVGLNLLVNYFTTVGISLIILYGLEIAEYLLFAVDLILFVVFIFRTGLRTIKKL
jgi:hypothetical protein